MNDIIKQAKSEVKANKAPKTVTVKSLIITGLIITISLALGAFAGITANNAINHTIDTQVNAKVKSLTSK